MAASLVRRLPHLALLLAALAAWWFADHALVPWIKDVAGFARITDRAQSVLLAHWVFDQLPRVLLCAVVWAAGTRLGLMPSIRRALGSGGSWPRVVTTGLIATVIFLVVTIAIGAAAGGRFGFHTDFPKMAGDLVSNLYEEFVYRGLFFGAFYGVATAASFPLRGGLDRRGVVLGAIGSCAVFAIGHEQYELALRVLVGVVGLIFVYPWTAARSLWAPWIPHTLGDVIVDSILEL